MDTLIVWSPGITLEVIEKQVIQKAYAFYRGNKTATANALGIAVRTLDHKLERYETDIKNEKVREENARAEQERFLARSRGQVPASPSGTSKAEGGGVRPTSGVRVESTLDSSEKPTVPMPEQQKVQSVLPAQSSQGGHKRAR